MARKSVRASSLVQYLSVIGTLAIAGCSQYLEKSDEIVLTPLYDVSRDLEVVATTFRTAQNRVSERGPEYQKATDRVAQAVAKVESIRQDSVGLEKEIKGNADLRAYHSELSSLLDATETLASKVQDALLVQRDLAGSHTAVARAAAQVARRSEVVRTTRTKLVRRRH